MNLLDFLIAPAFAQNAPSAPNPWQFPIMMVVLFAIMYFLMIRPQMKRQKEHRAMVEKLAVGDEVITASGIAGVVRKLGDSFITVEIADNVEIRVQKTAVGNVLPKGSLKSA
ncbi:preprotein translocase subunit YajC [Luteimonas terricola]|uniref:Sec translocon accessory complex subunit YajC n=1 Tax=Luteimonas terricola TaxID=645597 RepID=A0ABQ2EDY0_9GAMM|nr:preprotein translocase subunit YajC [Luteimonas terricola]GGK07557.1 preprotein translocase subunit YajC [Luteimonas terricola]